MDVLITDTDPVSQGVLEALLAEAEHRVIVCPDGVEACGALQRDDAPKLAILNWMIPGMTGTEVCRKVREATHSNLPYIIFVTAKDQKQHVVEGLKAGADDYVTKPFDHDELRARVQVGMRVVELQERLLELERTRVLTETAGAAAHEMNQPLTVLMGCVELLKGQPEGTRPQASLLERIYTAAKRISEIVRKIGGARAYTTRPYVSGTRIVDFDATAEEEER